MVKIGGNLEIKIARHLNLGQKYNLSNKYIQYNIWGGECLVICFRLHRLFKGEVINILT